MDCHCFSLWHVKTLLYFLSFTGRILSIWRTTGKQLQWPCKVFLHPFGFCFFLWANAMEVAVAVLQIQRGRGGEAHFRCRRGSCLPDVSKLQQNMGGQDQNSDYHGAKQRAYLIKAKKKQEEKTTKNKTRALSIKKQRLVEKKHWSKFVQKNIKRKTGRTSWEWPDRGLSGSKQKKHISRTKTRERERHTSTFSGWKFFFWTFTLPG